jgi:phytoene dehydrogenase-like protein
MAAKPVVIIWAGVGGLSAAIRLAAAGRRVVMFEQNPAVGGKMAQIRQAGYRWDTGPSVITMRPVLEDLFAASGRNLAGYVTLTPVDPLTRYFYPDGVVLDATRNLPDMLGQIAALDERDVEGYLAFLAYAARLHRLTGPTFIYDRPPPGAVWPACRLKMPSKWTAGAPWTRPFAVTCARPICGNCWAALPPMWEPAPTRPRPRSM